MIRVILDTNFLLIPSQFKIDIFSELTRLVPSDFELYVVKPTLRELDNLMQKGKGKDKRAAKMGRQLIDFANIEVIETDDEYVDKAILNGIKEGDVVATVDKELKSFLLKKGISVVVMRKKSHLHLVQA